MLESFLRRFVSEDMKVVLAAMEKWGYTESTPTPVNEMYAAAIEYGTRMDSFVLRHLAHRLKQEARKKAALTKAKDTAGKILMGETFTPVQQATTGYVTPQQQAAMQQQAAAMQQQQQAAMQQQAVMQQYDNKGWGQYTTQQGSGLLGLGIGGVL